MRKLLLLALSPLAVLFLNAEAKALSGADFNPGRIIDDVVFQNKDSMSVAQIQQFLESKITSCDTKGTKTVSYKYNPNTRKVDAHNVSEVGDVWVTTSRALYTYRSHIYIKYFRQPNDKYSGSPGAIPEYSNPPTSFIPTSTNLRPAGVPDSENAWYTENTNMVCLKDYFQNPTTKQSNYGSGIIPSGARSASQLIWDVSQAQNINPQVLLVLLQKEQSLITDDWPWPRQYEAATGANCPDTAPCDPLYAGFYAQTLRAASLFNYYVNNFDEFNYAPGWNNILFHPFNTYCGTQRVFIENRFTAALYIYTPYVPNQAALDNIYGDGDIADPAPPNCSSFGNRNFWRMFNDWFGSTLAPSFMSQVHENPTYMVINRDETNTAYFYFKNVGTAFWKDDSSAFPGYPPVRLASTNPINRWSLFRNTDWVSGSRVSGDFDQVLEADAITLATDQHTVSPGQIVRYKVNFRANNSIPGGVYQEQFQLIREGTPNWNMGGMVSQLIGVHIPTYAAAFHSQSSYPTIPRGSSQSSVIRFRNTGNMPWYDTSSVPAGQFPVRLATSWPINRSSVFNGGWPATSRPSVEFSRVFEADGTTLATNQEIVQPGQVAEFTFNLTTPNNTATGFYPEYFEPIREGAPGFSWNMGAVAWLGVTVPQDIYRAAFHSQSPYPTIARGANQEVFIRFRNTGNMPWYDTSSVPAGQFPVRLATSWPINRSSVFSSSWPTPSRPAIEFARVFESDAVTLSPNQDVVQPGQIAEYRFTLNAPTNANPGFYPEHFDLIREGAPGFSWYVGTSAWLGITIP